MPPITINSGKLLVTDPYYGKNYIDGPRPSSLVLNVKRGKWKVYKEEGEMGDWGWRVTRLILVHTDHSLEDIERVDCRQSAGIIRVDSGCAGMYDFDEFPMTDDFTTFKLNDEYFNKKMVVLDYGVTSSSGFGDGSYDVYKVDRNGQTVFVEIEYINEETIGKYNILDQSQERKVKKFI